MSTWESFRATGLASVESSISVIAILGFGYYCRTKNIVTDAGEIFVSKLSTHIFLPCLLITEMGPHMTIESITQYWPLLLAPMLVLLLTYFVGNTIGHKMLGFPKYITAGVMFNNTTSLPLLMLKALGTTGALDVLIPEGGKLEDVVKKASAYVLLVSIVHTIARFSLGPIIMGQKEEKFEGETTPLLGGTVGRLEQQAETFYEKHIAKYINAAVVGGLIAIFIGIIPPLKWFIFDFTPMKASLTQAVTDLGELYPALQLFVLGAKLTAKPTEPVKPSYMAFIFCTRFVLVPIIAISSVFYLRQADENVWTRDPILDFILMMTPAGPPAITLAAVAELGGVGEDELASIAQMLLWSYAITPFIAPTVAVAIQVVKGEYGL
ncbi:hypothetical protein CJU89_2380 [Yarrowia sp. B02]|nr:hypothetical protein CJU89_2380 [Yarrowia sp. B02]